MGKRVVGVERYRFFVLAYGALNGGWCALDYQVSAPQVSIMSLAACCCDYLGNRFNLQFQVFLQGINYGG